MGLSRLASGKTLDSDIKKLEAALDALKLEYKTGATYISVRCPFASTQEAHGGTDNKPSFVFFVSYGTCRCYTCGYRSSIYAFLESYAKLTSNPVDFEYFQYAIIAPEKKEEDNIILDEDILSVFQEDQRVLDYFKSRNIDVSGSPLKYLYHNSKKRVVLPIRDEYNSLVGAVGRSTLKTTFKTYNYFGVKTSRCLAGLECCNASNKILVVEGMTDQANAYDKIKQLGLNFDVYATLTASLSKWQALKLIDQCRPIFMAYDMDQAGRRGQYDALNLLDSLGATPLVNCSWDKVKDVGEMDLDTFHSVFAG